MPGSALPAVPRDRALPMLKPGKSLRFAIMPEGQDPDDLIKAAGPSAMTKGLDQALPMVELLWRLGDSRAGV